MRAGRRLGELVRRSRTCSRRRPRQSSAAIVEARRHESGVVWGLGAHVIKTGLGPIVIDLMERGFVSAITTNGTAIIHDFEVALVGGWSEDVDVALGPGRFGVAEKPGRLLNLAIADGVDAGLGLGQGRRSIPDGPPAHSLRAAASSGLRAPRDPVTASVAIGTESSRCPRRLPAGRLARAACRNFRYFVSNVARLNQDVSSSIAVRLILPEVFLKAIALARNRGVAFDRPHHGRSGFRPPLPAADERRYTSTESFRSRSLAAGPGRAMHDSLLAPRVSMLTPEERSDQDQDDLLLVKPDVHPHRPDRVLGQESLAGSLR